VRSWQRNERHAGARTLLNALAERPIGSREQATAWIWRLTEASREVHERYATARWPSTKRLLGLLVNSSGPAHARNAHRLVSAAKRQEHRLAVSLLAAALAHSPEAESVLRRAREQATTKPQAVARDLARNFSGGGGRGRRRRPRQQAAKRSPNKPNEDEAKPNGDQAKAADAHSAIGVDATQGSK
jgi:hypothetical protein